MTDGEKKYYELWLREASAYQSATHDYYDERRWREALEKRMVRLSNIWQARARELEKVAEMIYDVQPELATVHDQAAWQIRVCANELIDIFADSYVDNEVDDDE